MTVDSSGNVQISNPCPLTMLGDNFIFYHPKQGHLFYLHVIEEQEEFFINVREFSEILFNAVIIIVHVDIDNYSGASV